ncbi:MAG TPA: radical SAM family heme chaperone HemW [Woeseiaceae bacterium]|nr:radical SAM family heme chaperone HemW [Woeseiaceae bacterium]
MSAQHPAPAAAPPTSLYVHLPWCVRKCPYCDFNSYTAGTAPPKARYLAALTKDLRLEAGRMPGREIISVFLGGGTPSFFSPGEIAGVLQAISAHFRLASDVEVTMEVNPGTVEGGDPAGYRAAGVNRLSIGAQSFSPASLTTLGRIHSPADTRRTVAAARAAGFDNFNLDLMFALPGQDVAAALADLDEALALAPPHLSWYQLTLEPNTVFHARPPGGLPDDETAWAIQEAGRERLARHGFEAYEVSAYARDGRRCRHNLNYWTFGDYYAAGAGAHGKLSTGNGVRRYAKPANPQAYMDDVERRTEPQPLGPALAAAEALFECMLNGLRLEAGVDEARALERTGLEAAAFRAAAAGALRRGLLERTPGGAWRPTSLGFRFLNDLQAEFLA